MLGGAVLPTYIHTYIHTYIRTYIHTGFLFGVIYNKKFFNYFHGLYGEAPPKRGTCFRLQVYERVEISLVDFRI